MARPVLRCSSTRAATRLSAASAETGVLEHAGQHGDHLAERPQQVQITEAASGLLEIGFQQQGQVAEALMTLAG